MSKVSVLVTGASGQLGRELQEFKTLHSNLDFIFTDRSQLDISDQEAIEIFFKNFQPSCCINCAAYTAVDKAESEQAQAYAINSEAVGFLAKACSKFGTKFIHISTDYVFDGTSSVPLKEDDATSPLNVYGASKLDGEKKAFDFSAQTVVLRTSWVYSAFGNNFVKTMMRLMREKSSIRVINDQVGSPTWAADLAAVILSIIQASTFKPGIYNYSNEGRISWYDFALAIKDAIGSGCEVNPIPTTEYPTPARRPYFSLLDKTKIQTEYGVAIADWKQSLAQCLHQLDEKSTK